MIITKSNDLELFYEQRKRCEKLYYDVIYPVCKDTGRICDEDTCPIIKKSAFIDEFVTAINKGWNG